MAGQNRSDAPLTEGKLMGDLEVISSNNILSSLNLTLLALHFLRLPGGERAAILGRRRGGKRKR